MRRVGPFNVYLDAEHLVVWAVTLALLGGLAWSVAVAAEDIRDTTPESEFAVAFDGETRMVTIGHAGGGAIRDRTTHRLSVVVIDESTGATAQFAWAEDGPWYADRGRGYPVAEGEVFTIDDPSVDVDDDGNYHDARASVGFHLAAGDRVIVRWRGETRGGRTVRRDLVNTTIEPTQNERLLLE